MSDDAGPIIEITCDSVSKPRPRRVVERIAPPLTTPCGASGCTALATWMRTDFFQQASPNVWMTLSAHCDVHKPPAS